jgi:putative transposase
MVPSRECGFRLPFPRGLVARGLSGVQFMISDPYQALKVVTATVLTGTAWQRCPLHFVSNALASAPKQADQLVASTSRKVFAQPDAKSAENSGGGRPMAFAGDIRDWLRCDGAEADVLPCLASPHKHWQ